METGKGNKGGKNICLDSLGDCLVDGEGVGKDGLERKVPNDRVGRKEDRIVEMDSKNYEFSKGIETPQDDFVGLSREQRKLKKFLYYARYSNTLCLLYTLIIMIVYFASIPKFSYAIYFFIFEFIQALSFVLSIYTTVNYTVCNRFMPPISSIFIVILIFVVAIVEESQWKIIYSVMILVSIITNYLAYCIIVYEGRMENEKIIKVRLDMKRVRKF